jgi:hemoglobin/transferrin/lactoferrin receptor protein
MCIRDRINEQSLELNVHLNERLIDIGEAQIVSSRSKFRLKDESLSLEIMNSKDIGIRPENTLADMVNSESGISVLRDGPWATSVNIRGLSGQNLVYLIDGSRIETSTNIAAGLSLLDVNDFESIEIIKGGISSLYGTGATGGVVNILTKKAAFNETPYLSSQIISGYNSVNEGYSNYLNLMSGGKNWSAKINGSMRKAGDTKVPGGKLENSSFKDESFSTALKYSPFENIILNLDYQNFSAYDVGIPGGAPFPVSASAKYNYAKRNLFAASAELNNVSKNLIRTELKYYKQIISRSVEIRPNPMATSNPKADHYTDGLLLQTDWYLSLHNNFIFGIDYWQREYNGTRKVTNTARNIISLDKPVPNSEFSSFGIFAKDDHRISEKFKVSLSGRYDFIDISNEETKNPQYVIINGIRNDAIKNDMASYSAYNESNRSISGSFGAVYTPAEDYDIVFNGGYNFRSPSLEERYQFIDLGGIVYLGNPELEPEEGIFIDAGLRVWKENFNFQLNLFYNSLSNLVQDDVLVPDSIYIKNNIGRARLIGFDGKMDYNFFEDLILYTSVSYVKGEDLSLNKDLPQIPPLNGKIGLVIPVSGLLKCDLRMTFASDQNKTGTGESRTGGFTYYDLNIESVRFELGLLKFKAAAGIQNIFNKKYREHLSTYRGIERLEPGRNIFAKLIFDID